MQTYLNWEPKKHTIARRWYKVEFNLFNAKKIIGPKEFPGYVQIPIGIGSRRTYIDAFSDTYQATLKLQDKNLVYSEFFVVWMELKLKCENSHNLIKKNFWKIFIH